MDVDDDLALAVSALAVCVSCGDLVEGVGGAYSRRESALLTKGCCGREVGLGVGCVLDIERAE